MSLFIDKKYVSLLSPRLENFRQKSEYLWNFRCPICNDSKKNKLKARGYIYRKKNDLFFMCHNCSSSTTISKLIKFLDPHLYKNYQLDRFKHDSHSNTKLPDFSLAKETPKFSTTHKINLPTIESLPEKHSAKQFLLNRKLSTTFYSTLFYAENFSDFIRKFLPNHSNTFVNDKRIIIPFYDEKNILLGIQGRAIETNPVKYITLKVSENSKKIFGLNRINFDKTIYIVEGPIDSLFLDNCLAVMDANLHKSSVLIGNYDFVYIWDNEPRNKNIVKQIEETIKLGKKVCIWPQNIKEKDINDMILSGYSSSELQAIIDANTYHDLSAKLKFQQWKKI